MVSHIETVSIQDARIRVAFLRQADRFGHVIQLIEGDVIHSLLSSVEGTPPDLFPPSPVLQQLHIEDRTDSLIGTRQVALLVGMAGSSHWSLSVEPDIARAALVFDVACRVHADTSSDLCTTYQPLAVPKLVAAERSVFAVMNTWLVTLGIEGFPDDPRGAMLSTDSLGIRISPPMISGVTRRWKYCVELARA